MSDATPTFGIIAEGPSDHMVLQLVLAGYFHDSDIDPNPLQPLRDATGTFEEKGGWHQVLEYCSSEKFRAAFNDNDYVIIQIDTDVSEEHPAYGVPHRSSAGRLYLCDELTDLVYTTLINKIGRDFYDAHRDRIIFAVCVHSLECWLLPLWCSDARRGRIQNCLKCLNEQLNKKEGFVIDAKDTRYYRVAAKRYANERTLRQHWENNPSLKIFIQHLEQRFHRGFVSGPP
jgi:hypothetical protein